MSIDLHCPICQKAIRAPDEAAGKTGRCPNCGKDLYIPRPRTEDDGDLTLAPIDEEAERLSEELRRESIDYAASLTREKAAPKSGKQPAAEPPSAAVNIPGEVKRYVMAMKEAQLDMAGQIAERLKSTGAKAREHVQGLLLDQMAPKIGDIPPQLVKGFLKALSKELSIK